MTDLKFLGMNLAQRGYLSSLYVWNDGAVVTVTGHMRRRHFFVQVEFHFDQHGVFMFTNHQLFAVWLMRGFKYWRGWRGYAAV